MFIGPEGHDQSDRSACGLHLLSHINRGLCSERMSDNYDWTLTDFLQMDSLSREALIVVVTVHGGGDAPLNQFSVERIQSGRENTGESFQQIDVAGSLRIGGQGCQANEKSS